MPILLPFCLRWQLPFSSLTLLGGLHNHASWWWGLKFPVNMNTGVIQQRMLQQALLSDLGCHQLLLSVVRPDACSFSCFAGLFCIWMQQGV